MDEVKKTQKGFLGACKDYFGFQPGQTLRAFADEMNAIDYGFKMEIFEFFKAQGIECVAPRLS